MTKACPKIRRSEKLVIRVTWMARVREVSPNNLQPSLQLTNFSTNHFTRHISSATASLTPIIFTSNNFAKK